MFQTIVVCLTSTDAHMHVDTHAHGLTHAQPYQSSYSRKPANREEIGSLALRCRSAKEKLLAAAKVERAYCLVMEKEWRSTHCTLSETLSNDFSVSPCTATVTQCLIMAGLCVCVHLCVRLRAVFVIKCVTELTCSVIWHRCQRVCACVWSDTK